MSKKMESSVNKRLSEKGLITSKIPPTKIIINVSN